MGKRIIKYDVRLFRSEAVRVIEEVFSVHEWTVEKLGMLALDNANKVIGVHTIATGTLTEAIVDIRGIFQRALLNNARSIILFHNHPAGSNKPSSSDITLTNSVKKAGELLDIKLLDHIILYAPEKGLSMAESHYL